MTTTTMLAVLLLHLLLLLLVGTITSAFITTTVPLQRSTTPTTTRASLPLYSTKKNIKFPPIVSLLTTPQVLLPGETARIWTDEVQLVEDSIRHAHGVVAMGVVLNDEALLQIASLCEISNCDDNDKQNGGLYVTLTCVGRVRLQEEEQEHPYFKFKCDTVQENVAANDDIDNDEASTFEKCNLVADNIETFMQQLSRKEIDNDDDDNDNDDEENNLQQRYKRAYGRAVQVLDAAEADNGNNSTLDLLTAISWAAFTAVHDEELEQYRVRALDYDNLFDRLKLAQYMLREKELRLQGMALLQQQEDEVPSDAAYYTEGFQ